LPAVLVGVMCVVHAAMRRGEDEMEEADRITAGDMMRSLDLHESLLARRQAAARLAVEEPLPSVASAAHALQEPRTAENVTPLTLGDRKRSDP
ncbi:MAG TPA: hypothetical protein VIZ90_14020, partial [Rhizobiaceae bacterium]